MDLSLLFSIICLVAIVAILYVPIVLVFRRQAKKHDAALKYFAPKDRL